MRYVVLLRYGLWRLHVVLRVSRAGDGEISCGEAAAPLAGMTWRADGRFRLTTQSGAAEQSLRRPLSAIKEPLVAYSIPGPKLLEENNPVYVSDLDRGATIQMSAHAVLDEPHRVALQLVLVRRGDEPYHRETVPPDR